MLVGRGRRRGRRGAHLHREDRLAGRGDGERRARLVVAKAAVEVPDERLSPQVAVARRADLLHADDVEVPRGVRLARGRRQPRVERREV